MSLLGMKKLSRNHVVITVALTINLMVLGLYSVAQNTDGQRSPTGATNTESLRSALQKCLPADIKLEDVVETSIAASANGQHRVTVEQKLNELRATCSRDNKLVDASGRQIVFYHLIGCWGNPPPDYRELLEKQREEIGKLKQEYTVIEMTCNPSGISIS